MNKETQDILDRWAAQGLTPADVLALWEEQQATARSGARERYDASAKGQTWKQRYYAPGGGRHQALADKKIIEIHSRQSQVRQEASRRKSLNKPEAHAARTAVSNALRDGRMVKPDHCHYDEPLDTLHGGRLEADHYLGYEEGHWLDVHWTCRRCHVVLEKQRQGEGFGREQLSL